MFLLSKKMFALTGMAVFILLGIQATRPPQEEKPIYKNLKILSKKISDKDMDYVMKTFGKQLGVNCLFCHPGKQTGSVFTIDYVTDQLQNKRIARDMLRMTMQLNKKYFDTKLNAAMTNRGRIWCKTCHQGTPVPLMNARPK